MSTAGVPFADHLSVTSASAMSTQAASADIQYLKGFLPGVLFWTKMTEKVEETSAGQSKQVELLRSRLPAEYRPEKHSIDLANTLQVVVAALLALTDGQLVPEPKPAGAEPPATSAEPTPEAIELSEEDAILTSPVIILSPQRATEETTEDPLGTLGEFLKRDAAELAADEDKPRLGTLGEFLKRDPAELALDEAVPAGERLVKVDADLTAKAGSPRTAAGSVTQPGSEPEPSIAGRSYSCSGCSAPSEHLDDSQRAVDRVLAPQPGDVRPVHTSCDAPEKTASEEGPDDDPNSPGCPSPTRLEWQLRVTPLPDQGLAGAGQQVPTDAAKPDLQKHASRIPSKDGGT
jgi:hypothetical protein